MLSPALLLCLAAPSGTGDTQPPVARIDFPPSSALTDAASLRVRGSASDSSGVAAVRVNGVTASSADGFETWWVELPLAIGENELVVEAVDTLGNLDRAAASGVVRRDGGLLVRPASLALDVAGGRAHVVDFAHGVSPVYASARFLGIDLESGAVSLESSLPTHPGPLPGRTLVAESSAGELEFDALGGRLLFLDADFGELLAVDPQSGARRILSGPQNGSGPGLMGAKAFDLSLDGATALVLRTQYNVSFDPLSTALIAVDLASGERTLLKHLSLGQGGGDKVPSVTRVGSTAVLLAGNGATLWGVIEPSGAETLLSEPSLALGKTWSGPLAMTAGEDGRAWILGEQWLAPLSTLYRLDLATGAYDDVDVAWPTASPAIVDLDGDPEGARLFATDRENAAVLLVRGDGSQVEVLARNTIGEGVPFGADVGHGAALDRSGRLLVLDRHDPALIAVDPHDGSRSTVTSITQGAGPLMLAPEDTCVDAAAAVPRALVFDSGFGRLFGVDLASGDRAIVSGGSVGSGPQFKASGWSNAASEDDLWVDCAGDQAYVCDKGGGGEYLSRLLQVDLASGDRTVVSGAGVGLGPPLQHCRDMVLAPELGLALVAIAAPKAVYAVDLASGDRSELSGPAKGAGPLWDFPGDLAWDPAAGRVLVQDRYGVVHAVDVATGDRLVLAHVEPSHGPGLAGSRSLALQRSAQGVGPILLHFDVEYRAVAAVDLWPDPWTGQVPGDRVLVSR